MKTFKQFLADDLPANNTGNVQGMRTEPVIRKKDQLKYFRRNVTSTGLLQPRRTT